MFKLNKNKAGVGFILAVLLSLFVFLPIHTKAETFTEAYNNYGSTKTTNTGVLPSLDNSDGLQPMGAIEPAEEIDIALPGETVKTTSSNMGIQTAGPASDSANDSSISKGTSASQTSVSAQNVGTCVGGQLLARLLASSITSGIKSVGKSIMGSATESTTKVPVTLIGTQVATNIEADTNARTGSFMSGTNTQIGVGWDGIGYCIVNTIIDYIINSTIQWANTGFKGNPAFIRNPEQFFQNIANREASIFIKELAYETTGINVCSPFRIQIATGLKAAYNGSLNNMKNYGSCTLTQMQQNMMQSGQYTITTPTDWIALTRPENNIYYSYIKAGDELHNRINVKRNTATLDLTINKGFLSYKKCKDDTKPESKTNTCEVKTPGIMIADGLSKTLGMSKDRLVNAQRFDQMVDAIVNNLIKIAISKTMEEITGKEASQAVVSDYYTAVANTSTLSGYNTNYNTNSNVAVNNCNYDSTSLIKTVTSSFNSIDTDGTAKPPFDDPDYQSQTSLPGMNANTMNYVVNPRGQWSTEGGLPMGTKVAIRDNTTGVTTCGIIGDNGSQYQWGEISLNLARTLGVWTEGMGNRANQHNVTYSFYSK